MSKRYIIPIFVPHFGCPHDCIFCNQKKITNISTTTTPKEVEEIINKYLSYFTRDAIIEVAFYGGSFTAIDMEIQSQLLEVPYKYKKAGIIHEIRLSTRPDAIDREILKNLKSYGVDTIELGVQSMDEEVLLASDRGHGIAHVYSSSKMIKEYGFNLGLQMMVGLPKDTLEKDMFTAREFISIKPDFVRIYPTLVIKDTYLNFLYENGGYSPLSIDDAINICIPIYISFYLKNINIIRLGLQVTDNIQLGMDVVSGPFHPAFRQLVEAEIFRLVIEERLDEKGYDLSGKDLIIRVNKSNVSNVSGQKSKNIDYLREKYKLAKLKIYQEDMDKDHIIISSEALLDKIDLRLWMAKYIDRLGV